MVNRSSTPRTDLPYLRRRVKPPLPAAQPEATANPAAVAPAAPAAQQPAGLVLGRNAPPSAANPRAAKLAARREAARNEDHEVGLLFPAPGIADVFELNLRERVLRLTALESAVGTMVVSGSTAMAWESTRRVVGGADAAGHTAGSPVKTSGNRPLVGYDGTAALVSLRHVRELRRAIFINRSSGTMGVQLFSGATVALPPVAGGIQLVLLVHRIGNVLELRAEPVPEAWEDLQIWQEFDFTMTHQAPAGAYGR
ncbi:hypothetical protein [Arthrobacter sp. SDTb3-6]|uniref:hypothetical protein n=1 Tax=Arthrobacter sp. SDTb3-6 TaxID=2713571 RepID=UPI00159D8C6E|nr:hypothetical protein [Arthrobacter sp. SDTb3-6]NVM98296.1 hypothetical protein [Arthrobacter sp. SDTb3-6]